MRTKARAHVLSFWTVTGVGRNSRHRYATSKHAPAAHAPIVSSRPMHSPAPGCANYTKFLTCRWRERAAAGARAAPGRSAQARARPRLTTASERGTIYIYV
ncbi:hypothetical protein EVAR_21387_1 [Eumeta japonica]|uniref:Uncharacterized protein n=1 Tax=Eumeta variegata TaxID=151549 RepID=A0A4C1VHM4_EUMVA|nr:hypothetical protein EVAR_21387_1 [Eumeta japonica]